jgi:hypothetical protein
MAATQSSPDLSVVDSPTEESGAKSSAAPERGPLPAAAPAERPPAESKPRRGAPIWVLVAVAAIGAGFYLQQYQRAEKLGAQVVSLQGELAEAGEQLTAYQSHLAAVRTSVADLSSRMGSLSTLVNIDPLAAPIAETTAADAAITARNPNPITDPAPALAPGAALSPIETIPTAPEGTPSGAMAPLDPESASAVLESAIGTTIESSEVDGSTPPAAVDPFERPTFGSDAYHTPRGGSAI